MKTYMSYRASRNLILVVFVIFSFFLIALSVYVRNRGDYDTRSEAAVETPKELFVHESDDLRGIPRVVSVDPKVAQEKEYFTYYLRLVDSDDKLDDIEMYMLESPDWLYFDSAAQHFYGMPKVGEVDTEKVVVHIDDGEHLVEHTFYLLILPEDEQVF